MTGHVHAGSGGRRRLLIAFGITVVVLVAELVGVVLTGSLALLVDAAHVLTDAGGLLMALVASTLVTRAATSRRTWGLRRAEVLAATLQAAVLLGVGVFVVIEGVQRVFEPTDLPSAQLLVFGVIGLVGNLASLAVLYPSRHDDFNLSGAFLEVLSDALGSIGVIVAAIVIALTGWSGADAVAAVFIGVLIVPRAIKLLRETVEVLLESTPAGLDLDDVRAHILEISHVRSVHDLHATQIAKNLPVLTAHVVIDDECFHDGHSPELLDELQQCVASHFDVSVDHSTFQLEPAAHSAHEPGAHP